CRPGNAHTLSAGLPGSACIAIVARRVGEIDVGAAARRETGIVRTGVPVVTGQRRTVLADSGQADARGMAGVDRRPARGAVGGDQVRARLAGARLDRARIAIVGTWNAGSRRTETVGVALVEPAAVRGRAVRPGQRNADATEQCGIPLIDHAGRRRRTGAV